MHGYIAPILTAHVPYLRAAGREPEGEDALHETIAYALIPLVNVLSDLYEHGVRFQIGLAWSPILLEQLADRVVQKHFVVWMERWLREREQRAQQAAADDHGQYLASFDIEWGQGILRSFTERYGRNLITPLRELCQQRVLEPLASAATHAYLPLLERGESIRAQLSVGTLSVTRHLGRRPRGLWLPECGYRSGMLPFLSDYHLSYGVVDPASLPTDDPVASRIPYRMAGANLYALARDAQAAELVYTPEPGYPGDPLYRAMHRDDYLTPSAWRNGLTPERQPYDPYDAFLRAREHAEHFYQTALAQLQEVRSRMRQVGLLVVPLDAELFGRRWFEGPIWLRALIQRLSEQHDVLLTTPSAYLRTHQPRQQVLLRDGSWGESGDHRAWGGPRVHTFWQAINEAEERLTHAIANPGDLERPLLERILAQALRELLLAQSSDWPLLLNQQVENEPLQRVSLHLQRCMRLCAMAESADPQGMIGMLDEYEERDNPFPDVNYRVFTG